MITTSLVLPQYSLKLKMCSLCLDQSYCKKNFTCKVVLTPSLLTLLWLALKSYTIQLLRAARDLDLFSDAIPIFDTNEIAKNEKRIHGQKSDEILSTINLSFDSWSWSVLLQSYSRLKIPLFAIHEFNVGFSFTIHLLQPNCMRIWMQFHSSCY